MPTKPLLKLSVPAFGILMLAMLWGAVLYQDRQTRDLREAAYHLELINYARLLEAHTRSILRGLDQVVTHVKAEYEDNPEQFDLRAQVARSPILKGLSVQVGIINTQGILIASTAPPSPERIDLSDREHFRTHVATDSGQLFVSKPVLGRASGKWSIQLARRINNKDGTFGGVVVVSLSPDYIADIYHQIDLGQDSAIIVVGRDGIVRASAMGEDRTVGQSFAEASFFGDLWTAAEGFVQGASPIDGTMGIGAYRRLDDYPLAVIVNRPAITLSQAQANEHQLFVIAGVGGTLMIVVGSLLLQWQILRQQATERRLRTREIELEEARSGLVQRNRDLEQFSEVLAHHLQEPVRIQHAFCQRLAKLLPAPLDPDAQKALQFVMDGAMRQRLLLRDVQLYLSLEKLPPPAAPCNPATALDTALQRLKREIAASGATIEHDLLPEVVIDLGRLSDIFTILLENAITYRRSEEPLRIRVAAEIGDKQAVLSVTDNGIGIPAEFHERVFRVFERLDPGPGRPGTGIGLALAKRIVEAARGRIWIEPPEGPGTRVCFSIAR